MEFITESEVVNELEISSTEKICFSIIGRMMEEDYKVKMRRFFLDDKEHWKPEKKSLVLDSEYLSLFLDIIRELDDELTAFRAMDAKCEVCGETECEATCEEECPKRLRELKIKTATKKRQ